MSTKATWWLTKNLTAASIDLRDKHIQFIGTSNEYRPTPQSPPVTTALSVRGSRSTESQARQVRSMYCQYLHERLPPLGPLLRQNFRWPFIFPNCPTCVCCIGRLVFVSDKTRGQQLQPFVFPVWLRFDCASTRDTGLDPAISREPEPHRQSLTGRQ